MAVAAEAVFGPWVILLSSPSLLSLGSEAAGLVEGADRVVGLGLSPEVRAGKGPGDAPAQASASLSYSSANNSPAACVGDCEVDTVYQMFQGFMSFRRPSVK